MWKYSKCLTLYLNFEICTVSDISEYIYELIIGCYIKGLI